LPGVSSFDFLRDELALSAPSDASDVERLRAEFGRQLPEDYLAFLTAHDGADGAVGRLDPAAAIGRADDVYPEHDHMRGLVIFGSNGGLEAFCFDHDGSVLVVPWIGGREDAIPQGTFPEFLARLVDGRLFEPGA
jgi:hypothetical protein